MTTFEQNFQFSQLAQAAYARFNEFSSPNEALTSSADFSSTQADRFLGSTGYSVLDQSANPNDQYGFSATLFQNNESGEITLAIRGTEPNAADGSGTIDLFGADADILFSGKATNQIYSLYNYVQRLVTPTNNSVAQWERVNEVGPGGNIIQVWRLTASADGLGLLSPTTQINVTGHSLGGHLAMAFARLFPSMTQAVYTYNAPGFQNSSAVNELFATLGGAGDEAAPKCLPVLCRRRLASLDPMRPHGRSKNRLNITIALPLAA